MVQAVEDLQRRFFYSRPKVWQVVSDPSALDDPLRLPCEIRYHLAIHPMRYRALKDFLSRGGGIAFVRDYSVPSHVLAAVHRISQTQNGALYPWLEDLFVRSCRPVWSDVDSEEAEQFGIDLHEELRHIQTHQRERFSVSLLQANHASVTDDDAALIEGIRRDLQVLHAAEMSYQISLAMQQSSRAPIVLLLSMLIVLAPIAHALNLAWPGFGIVFMLLAVSILYESRDLHRAYLYGSASWQLKRLLLQRVPYAVLLLLLACFIWPLIHVGQFFAAGLLFSFCLMLFPFRAYLLRVFEIRRQHQTLIRQNYSSDATLFGWLALYQGPAWWVRPLNYMLAFVYLPIFFVLFSSALMNGWVLGVFAISWVWALFGLTQLWQLALRWRFERRIHRLLAQTIITSSSFI